jgi:hypothetical protein
LRDSIKAIFFRAAARLDLLFPCDGLDHGLVQFIPNQHLAAIFGRNDAAGRHVIGRGHGRPGRSEHDQKARKKLTREQEIDRSIDRGTVPARYRSRVPKEYQQYVPFEKGQAAYSAERFAQRYCLMQRAAAVTLPGPLQ